MRVVPPLPRKQLRKLRTPTAQLLGAIGMAVFGAWLIAGWMVGVVLIVAAVGLGADAVLRDDGNTTTQRHTHEDVLERYRRAR